jgi:hypothetical protein
MIKKAYPYVQDVDDALFGTINDLMCKKECPCSPKGLLNIANLDEAIATKLIDES